MMNNQQSVFFRFLDIVIYSLLLISFASLALVIYSGFNIDQFVYSYPNIHIHEAGNLGYLSVIFLSVFITDLILILYRKKWAFYLFYVCVLVLLALLFLQDDIDKVNIFILLLLMLIFGTAHYKITKLILASSKKEENSD